MKKKMIIPILAIIVLLLLIFVVYKTSQSRNIQITSSITIEAPTDSVFNVVADLNHFNKWSPFLSNDPDLKTEIKGTKIVGSQFHWNGKEGKEVGYMEISKIERSSNVLMECFIQKPFEGSSSFDYKLEKQGDNTLVTQNFQMQSSFIPAFFIWISGTEATMKATNEKGLDNLKTLLTKQ